MLPEVMFLPIYFKVMSHRFLKYSILRVRAVCVCECVLIWYTAVQVTFKMCYHFMWSGRQWTKLHIQTCISIPGLLFMYLFVLESNSHINLFSYWSEMVGIFLIYYNRKIFKKAVLLPDRIFKYKEFQ